MLTEKNKQKPYLHEEVRLALLSLQNESSYFTFKKLIRQNMEWKDKSKKKQIKNLLLKLDKLKIIKYIKLEDRKAYYINTLDPNRWHKPHLQYLKYKAQTKGIEVSQAELDKVYSEHGGVNGRITPYRYIENKIKSVNNTHYTSVINVK